MTAPQIYVSFPGTAREALGFYADVFGGELSLYTYEEFSRSDGPPEAIAHGVLNGVVALAGSDAAAGQKRSGSKASCSRCWAPPNRRFSTSGSTNSPLAAG